MKNVLLLLPGILAVGCAGPCYTPSRAVMVLTAPVVLPMIALDPRSYHGKDGYSMRNAIPYLGDQKLKAIDRFERDYMVTKFSLPPDFNFSRERVGMYDKVTFSQANGRRRVLYFDTFPNEVAASGVKPAKEGT
ncbi:hypothetical protein [Haloferula sp. BvORR071]|uniref:hypothetical protein n=1 Tax=Haloferula sp. BvORR071 TaxID=1396141 RepID=UPI002240FAA7|nr:hypothetical protein [Haloferula sp. BvORR071]